MRQIREGFGSLLGAYLFLAVVAAASAGLNTDFSAPPRFDGAGYAVLGKALASGRGYREINKPESPRHDHFPPGYPAGLALVWWFTGSSVAVAHVFSVFCMITAVLLASRWLRAVYSPGTAFILGLALALNWTWGRVGGSIQSEPYFMVWELLTVLVAVKAGCRGGLRVGILLGVMVAATTLVRHIGACLGLAVLLDLGLRRRWKVLLSTVITALVLILPWVTWLVMVHQRSQLSLFTIEGLGARMAGQALFYLQRLPDQIIGPFVEVGTAPHHRWCIAILANLWAVMASAIMIWGWVGTLWSPSRRLAGIIPFITLTVLLVWPFTEAGRFLIPLVPFLLVGLTEGVAHVIARLGVERSEDWAAAIILAASIPYSTYAVINGRAAAERASHADFDAACQWISQQSARSGLVLTRHPGEVFWQSGHPAIEPDSPDPNVIAQLINDQGVVYVLIDENRYINSALSPLEQYIERYPERVALVWATSHGNASIRVFKTRRAK